jgi:Uma2 family endonuclease
MTAARTATEADLRRMPDDGWGYELIDGEIRRYELGGCRHSLVSVALSARLHRHVEGRLQGCVLGPNTGFRLPNRNVRVPDVSFTSCERRGQLADDFVPVAPELAVEILAPHDPPRYVLEKVGEYLLAGTRLVWVIDPEQRAAAVYRSLTAVRALGPEDTLDGEDVVPGFRCRLSEILR